MNTSTRSGPEVRDCYGRLYRTGVSDRELVGHSRRWMFWLCWAATFAAGLPQYGYGVLLPTVAAAHGWSWTGALAELAAFVVVQAGVAFPAAWLLDRGVASPRALLIAGGLLCSVGLVTLAHNDNPAVTVLGYAVAGGTGVGLVYPTCTAIVARWYPERSAARISLVSGAFACGAVPLAFLWPRIDVHNVAGYLDVVGAAVLLVVVGSGMLISAPPPGWWPVHIDPRAWVLDRRLNRSLLRNQPAVRTFPPREAVHNSTFRAVYVLLVVASAMLLCDLAYLTAIATRSVFPAPVIATSFALLVGGNGVARAAMGRLSDRLGRRAVLTVVLAIGGSAQLALLAGGHQGSAGLILLGSGCAALGAGCCFPVCAALIRDYFGESRALQNFGIVYSAKAVGAIGGIGLVAVTSGGAVALTVMAGLGLGGGLLANRLRQPGRPATLLPRPVRSTLTPEQGSFASGARESVR